MRQSFLNLKINKKNGFKKKNDDYFEVSYVELSFKSDSGLSVNNC